METDYLIQLMALMRELIQHLHAATKTFLAILASFCEILSHAHIRTHDSSAFNVATVMAFRQAKQYNEINTLPPSDNSHEISPQKQTRRNDRR